MQNSQIQLKQQSFTYKNVPINIYNKYKASDYTSTH